MAARPGCAPPPRCLRKRRSVAKPSAPACAPALRRARVSAQRRARSRVPAPSRLVLCHVVVIKNRPKKSRADHQIHVSNGRDRVDGVRSELFSFPEVLDVFVTSRPDALVVVCSGRPRPGDWLGALRRVGYDVPARRRATAAAFDPDRADVLERADRQAPFASTPAAVRRAGTEAFRPSFERPTRARFCRATMACSKNSTMNRT